jgi:antirestriction protein ArdC
MKDPLSIQIHNRARFEQGEPGEWLKLPATAEQLQVIMRRIGLTAENPQDFFINGIESPIEAVARLTLENAQAASIDELNYLAARLEPLDPAQIEKLNVSGDMLGYWDDVHHLTEYVQNSEYFMYIPDITTHAALGNYYLNKSGLVQMPEGWKAAVDIERLGQLAAEQEKGTLWDNGYILETGDQWEPVNEIPQEYRIMSLPQPGLNRDEPPIEYDAAPTVATAPPPELAADPQPVKVIALESTNPADKLKEITDKLESGIAGIFESEQYADYLKTLSKFHDYSLNNTILIAMQKPDASHVAGFNTWKNEFERNVMKGQKGIKIIAPSPYKVKVQQEKTDPATGKPVMGADGKPVKEEVERKIPAYKVVSVFDVSQTEGKELPTLGADTLTGDVEQYKDFFAALEKASPVPVAFENIEGGAKGYYHQIDKRIAIDEGMSELQTLKTAIHEIAHARLHDIDAPEQDEQPRADRRTREVEAESVAYTVCQHYGLDTSDYSFGYVAGWSSGKELTELKASLETIRTTAAALITEIDGHFAELTQDREQTAEQDAPAPEQGDSVYNSLPPEQQQTLTAEIQATLQFFVDSDLKERGELSAGTLEAIAVQGYTYRDGDLVKLDDPEETPAQFSQTFAETMQGFYREHPPFLETEQMTNTSAPFVAHSIEVGYTVDLHRALNNMDAYPEYKATADNLRGRLEAITPAPEQERAEPQQGDTYTIFQLKDGDETRYYRFEPLDRLQAAGLEVDPGNYNLVYTGQLATGDTLEGIFERFNIDHPADFTGHSLSVSDVVTLNRGGTETAHYVDSFGFQDVPQFLQQQAQDFDMQQTTDSLQKIHDAVAAANPDKTMGVAAYNVAIKRLNRLNDNIPDNQPQLKAVIEHAAQSTDLSMLKQRMGVTMQEVSHIRAAEMSTEQNYNMIDGVPNNTPSVGELEAKAKAGEQISLHDLAKAIKAERSDSEPHQDTDKKPSIRGQLKAAQEERRDNTPPQRNRDKSPGLEV